MASTIDASIPIHKSHSRLWQILRWATCTLHCFCKKSKSLSLRPMVSNAPLALTSIYSEHLWRTPPKSSSLVPGWSHIENHEYCRHEDSPGKSIREARHWSVQGFGCSCVRLIEKVLCITVGSKYSWFLSTRRWLMKRIFVEQYRSFQYQQHLWWQLEHAQRGHAYI